MIGRHIPHAASAERLRFTPTPAQTAEMVDQFMKDLDVFCSLEIKRIGGVAG